MYQPRTLFQITGRGYPAATFKQAALVVIDAQEEYRSGSLPLPGLEGALDEITLLLEKARAQQAPVIHVRHVGTVGGLFDPHSPRIEFLPQALPLAGESVIDKRLPNAFAGTSLHELLQQLGKLDLIVCGFMTHICVSATVRAAKDHGYRCTLVESACASRDLPDRLEGIVSAHELQRIEIAALADNFATIVGHAHELP